MDILIFIGLTFVLILSFYLLARVCEEYFVDSLDKIAHRFKMSSDAAGATLMAMGSSAPELFISIIALIKAFMQPEVNIETLGVGIGTIVGSAIFNVLVIIGAAAITRKALIAWQPVIRDLLFYSLSIVLLIIVFLDAHVSLYETLMFVALYVVYVIAVVNWRKILPYKELDAPADLAPEPIDLDEYKGWKMIKRPFDKMLGFVFPDEKKFIGVFIVSIVIIAGLSWALVESAVEMAHILVIPPAIIALTVLAVGTSIPDLISSVIVAKEGRGGMAISNAFGSNIFDILVGLGIPWLITLLVTGDLIEVGKENLLLSSIILFGSVVFIFAWFLFRRWKIGKIGGTIFIGIYVAYVIWEIIKTAMQ